MSYLNGKALNDYEPTKWGGPGALLNMESTANCRSCRLLQSLPSSAWRRADGVVPREVDFL